MPARRAGARVSPFALRQALLARGGALLAAAFATGCDLLDEPATSTAPPVNYDVRAPALPTGAGTLPFDPRVARLLPETYVGTEQICDLVMVGAARTLRPEDVFGYRLPFRQARHARCLGTTGEGWADLYFRKDREALVEQIAPGTRIRVAVLAGEGGFDDYTPLEVVELLGPTPPETPRARAADEPSVADSFENPEVSHAIRTCAVTYAGQIQRVRDGALERPRDEEQEPGPTEVRYRGPSSPVPYPGSASHRLSVVCQHASGEVWVDVVFTRETFPAALDVQRGRTMALRVFRAEGGLGNHPIAVFLPLGAAEPNALPPTVADDAGVEAEAAADDADAGMANAEFQPTADPPATLAPPPAAEGTPEGNSALPL